jgi:hypothetical protein
VIVVRYAVLVALVVWVGGVAVLGGLVSPSVVDVLVSADPDGGRALANLLLGDIARQFQNLMYVCGVVALVGLVGLKFIGPPPIAFVPRVALVATMIGCAMFAGLQAQRSSTLMAISAGLGLISLFWYVRE